MKKLKKLLAVILSSVMLFSVAVNVFAEEETISVKPYYVTDVDVQFKMFSNYNTLETYTAMAVEKGYTEEEATILFADFYERFCNSPNRSDYGFRYNPIMTIRVTDGYVPVVEEFEEFGAISIRSNSIDSNFYSIGFADAKDAVDNLENIYSMENITSANLQASVDSIFIADYIDIACLVQTQPYYADLDGDYIAGKVADVVLLSKYIQGAIQLSDETKLAADLNIDGAIDTEDLQIIVNYLTNEITVLPYVVE